jgi:hypothetical protein
MSFLATFRAESHPSPAGEDRLGSVNFPTSCSPEAQSTLDQALALLHSFQYQEAGQVFSRASEADHGCAIAF